MNFNLYEIARTYPLDFAIWCGLLAIALYGVGLVLEARR
jgi:hypothetical protein